MTLPVAQAGQILFGTGWAEFTLLALVDTVLWALRVEGRRVGETAIDGVGTGLAT